MTRALADSYRAELVRAARKGLAFAPETGEPESWAVPEPEPVTWYQHAVAYAEMKWPRLAPHSRASLADALATVTPLLTRETSRRPPAADTARLVRARLQRPAALPHSWTAHGQRAGLGGAGLPAGQPARRPARHPGCPGRAVHTAGRLARGGEHDHPQAGSVPRRPRLRRRARAAARQPICLVRWRAPRAAAAVSPATVASPAQVRAILAQVGCVRPELAAFFGCLYYAALRPEEAVTLRRADLILPARGRGKVILTAACPRTGSAWTNTGKSPEPAASSTAPTAPSASSPSRPS